ncbi:unnamed protein product [Blepharisma stoltei]|uniref:AtPDCT1/2 transmembrane domain-containing protein n=1 Tax=Blepharisma stoltei TaxID=1481888 RepID=A0AAU9I9W8_9CILI|nr:unnamed protein product [Blepharisma stoltei]
MEDVHLLTNERVTRDTDWVVKFVEFNWKTKSSKSWFIARVTISLSVIAIIIANAFTGMLLRTWHVGCMWDALFEITTSPNEYFKENETSHNIITIISSLLIDFLLSSFTLHFILWGNSWRPIICLLSFYIFRGAIQASFVMECPKDWAWYYPGFPSLAVGYQKTSDFFYSGHVGVVTILTFFNRHTKRYILMWISISSIAIEFWVMIFLRGHYTIDVITGPLVAHYFWIVSGRVSPYLDRVSGYKEQ